MPIKKEDLDKIKTTLKGIDVDKLIAAAVATDEQPFPIPDGLLVLTAEEATTRDENMKTVGKKEGEVIGETKGKEIIVKKIAKKMGFDDAAITTIGTDPEKLEAAVQAKFKAGDAGLQAQVDALLKDKETLTAKATELEGKATQAQFDAQLISMFPKRNTTLKDSEILLLIKNELQFETVEGKVQVKKGGVLLQDPGTHAPLPLEKVLQDVFVERKWADAGAGSGEGGRGGGNSGGAGGAAGIKTLTAYTEKWKAENPGKNDNSPEFDADLSKHTKDIPDFNFQA